MSWKGTMNKTRRKALGALCDDVTSFFKDYEEALGPFKARHESLVAILRDIATDERDAANAAKGNKADELDSSASSLEDALSDLEAFEDDLDVRASEGDSIVLQIDDARGVE